MIQPLPIAKAAEEIFLLPEMANRHGLIAGATGTGKTVTLQGLAESFSAQGVPVFLADVKGDLAGLSQPGGQSPKVLERVAQLKLEGYTPAGLPGDILGCVRAERASGARHHFRDGAAAAVAPAQSQRDAGRRVDVWSSASPTNTACSCSISKDLRAMLNYVGENAPAVHHPVRQHLRRQHRGHPAQPARRSNRRAATSSSANPR